MNRGEALTVAELIQELEKCPQDCRVFYVESSVQHTEVSTVGAARIKSREVAFNEGYILTYRRCRRKSMWCY